MTPAPEKHYRFNARVVAVVDADTIDAHIDVGFGFACPKMRLRLLGIDAPETHGPTAPAGHRAAQRVSDLCLDRDVVLYTHKPDKYGRWLATVHVLEGCVNDLLIAEGHAVPYHGGKR